MEASGSSSIDRFGPEMKTEDPTSISRSSGKMVTRFDFLPANTNFSVSICAMTRSQTCGEPALGSCQMRPMPPKMDQLSRSFQVWNDAFFLLLGFCLTVHRPARAVLVFSRGKSLLESWVTTFFPTDSYP